MITLCPYCGHHLPYPIENGLTTCLNCRRVCDSCRLNKILSAAWLVRKQHISEPEYLVNHHGFAREDAEIAVRYAYEEGYTHDELVALLRKRPLLETYETPLDLAS